MASFTDQWSAWILERRFGGDERRARAMLEELGRVRDQILDYAELKPGDRLLDVGCGDGLIGFGALAREPGCSVVFSDASKRLVDQCRQLAAAAGLTERGRFLVAAAEDLSPIDDGSIDVVTTRSVLIYVEVKLRAFQEFYRVLRPGGRISLSEPINRYFVQSNGSPPPAFEPGPVLFVGQWFAAAQSIAAEEENAFEVALVPSGASGHRRPIAEARSYMGDTGPGAAPVHHSEIVDAVVEKTDTVTRHTEAVGQRFECPRRLVEAA